MYTYMYVHNNTHTYMYTQIDLVKQHVPIRSIFSPETLWTDAGTSSVHDDRTQERLSNWWQHYAL